MHTSIRFALTLSVMAVGLSGGCTTRIPGPSSAPAETPPQLQYLDERYEWNDPTAFGPVPDALRSAGDDYCQRNGFARASGYHPLARDEKGRTFEGGGYYCEGRKRASDGP
jgi:hypothetical protein